LGDEVNAIREASKTYEVINLSIQIPEEIVSGRDRRWSVIACLVVRPNAATSASPVAGYDDNAVFRHRAGTHASSGSIGFIGCADRSLS
jgi:hypothetical protein